MGCGELLLRFKKLAGIEPDVELEDTESIAPDHRGWQKYRLSDDEDEDEPDDEPRRGEEDDDSADAYEAEASDDSDPESAQVGRKRKRKAPPSPTKRKPGPKIHRVKDPVSLQEDRRARAARATKSKPVNDYTIGIPKPPKETRGVRGRRTCLVEHLTDRATQRDDPLGPHDDAYILGTIFNWFCSIGPVGDLNRFAYLQKIAGLPGPTEKRKAGELVRTGIQATMHRLVDHALQRGSLKPPTGVKRVTNQQTADMIAGESCLRSQPHAAALMSQCSDLRALAGQGPWLLSLARVDLDGQRAQPVSRPQQGRSQGGQRAPASARHASLQQDQDRTAQVWLSAVTTCAVVAGPTSQR
jgi:hypothetical protein